MAKSLLVFVAAAFGLIAAVLWALASYQRVRHDPKEVDEQGLHPFAIVETKGNVDVLKTADRQTRWNGWAALAASIAAAAQAASLLFPG